MRPYIAIIKDSFRDAIHSRVLWVMLILITLLLLLIAPFSYDDQQLTTNLTRVDMLEWDGLGPANLMAYLTEQGQSDEPSPGRRVWTLLDKKIQAVLLEVHEVRFEELSDSELLKLRKKTLGLPERTLVALNKMIRRDDFYDEDSWKEIEPSVELQELMDLPIDEIETEEHFRMNRLLLEAALPQFIRNSPPRSIVLTYAGARFPWAFPVAPKEFQNNVTSYVLMPVVLIFSSLGVFIAVLVTASIIPQTFDTGSLNLLLSKPVSRWKLFLAQYLGGCAFILLAMTYLFVGFWLILGLRLGAWNPKLLYYIPSFMFIFAIYYSVSALAGIIWRSTVVAAVVCILFYCCCCVFDVLKWSMELAVTPNHIAQVVPADESLVMVTLSGEIRRWSDREQSWEIIFLSEAEERNPNARSRVIHGPLYDAEGDQLVSVQMSRLVPDRTLSYGKREEKWRRRNGAALPPVPTELLQEPDGDILAITFLGLFRGYGDLSIVPLRETEDDLFGAPAEPSSDEDDGEQLEKGLENPLPNDDSNEEPKEGASDKDGESNLEEPNGDQSATDDPSRKESREETTEPGRGSDETTNPDEDPDLPASGFLPVGPDQQLTLNRPYASAMNGSKEELAIYSRGHVDIFRADDAGFYERQGGIDIEGDEERASMAFAGTRLLVGRSDGVITLFDTSDLSSVSKVDEHQLEGKVRPRFLAGSPSGRWFAVTFHNGNLWLLDTMSGEVSKALVSGQGSISTIRFTDDESLLVVDRWTRASEYSLDPVKLESRYAPNLTAFESAYRYVIVPLYSIFPKPRQINNVVEYFITGDETREGWFQWIVEQLFGPSNLEIARVQLHPWSLIWSGLLFIGVVLGFGCVYFSRQDF